MNAMPAVSDLANPARSSALISDRLTGYLVVCALPALFWTLVIAAAGAAMGFPTSTAALFGIGLAIAAFLTAVFSALTISPAR